MSVILVDIGNSGIKWSLYDRDGRGLGAVTRCARDREELPVALRDAGLAGTPIWLSSVAGIEFEAALGAALQAQGFGELHWAQAQAREAGLISSYDQPARMGVDRWLAMLAAREGRTEPVMVVDAGTALTIDLVAADGQHEGGYIIPGQRLMRDALLRDTQKVRFEDADHATVQPGTATTGCVAAGLTLAALGAVHYVLEHHAGYQLVVTGGDGRRLLDLGLPGEWRPSLVLEGLAIKYSRSSA